MLKKAIQVRNNDEKVMKMHPKQVRILEYIKKYQETMPFPPTFREIGLHVGCSASNVHYNLQQLEALGKVQLFPNTARGIRLVEAS